MKHFFTFIMLSFLLIEAKAQYYFPPLTGSTWDTISPQTLGWCDDKINDVFTLLDSKNTKAFIVLKDGKIAIEKYFGTFTKDSAWYWASAGKTITSFLIGIAQQDGLLSINDSTSIYLGKGWTSCSDENEGQITIRHQLTMTTGLNYQVPDLDCKSPSCLSCKAVAGSQWYYHNAPYLLLQDVIANASGMTYQQYTTSKLSVQTGITGIWLNGVFYSKPRSMARFGSLILNKGYWGNSTLLRDSNYYNEMTNTSQNLNEAYGYLWWLNGKSSFKLPGTTFTFQGKVIPNAPDELICGLGKNDQKLYIWPSQKMVIVRMGNAADTTSEVPIVLDTMLWNRLNKVFCIQPNGLENIESINHIEVFPNPANDYMDITNSGNVEVNAIFLTDITGKFINHIKVVGNNQKVDLTCYDRGAYILHMQLSNGMVLRKKLLKE